MNSSNEMHPGMIKKLTSPVIEKRRGHVRLICLQAAAAQRGDNEMPGVVRGWRGRDGQRPRRPVRQLLLSAAETA